MLYKNKGIDIEVTRLKRKSTAKVADIANTQEIFNTNSIVLRCKVKQFILNGAIFYLSFFLVIFLIMRITIKLIDFTNNHII